MFDFNLILLPLLGFLIGMLVSILGGGGGGLYAPLLILLFGIPTQTAVATSLASVLPTTVAGAFSHYREGNVDVRIGLILGIGGIFGTLIGVYIANMISPILLRRFLGVFTLIMIFPMLRSALKRRKTNYEVENHGNKENQTELKGFKKILASFFGIAGGIMAGVFGISGTPPVVAGLYSLGLPAILVVGTTVFILIFNSATGIVGYYLVGRLDIPLIILLGSGAVIGAFIGPKLLKKIDPKTLEKIYAPLLVGIMLILGSSLLLG
ncbi:MAG TPA: sulfite exporter TauE/SafE family protein [Methanobacterium sp.]|nr:sulfite exporter TauE/SafE family protein [Methanobacterium sp.]